MRFGVLSLVVMLGCAHGGTGRTASDRESLLAEISKIPIFDNHAHLPPLHSAEEIAREPLSVFPKPPFANAPFRLRYDNPEYIAAWRALWGYAWNDMTPEHLRWLHKTKLAHEREQGERYTAFVLGKLGVETLIGGGRSRARPMFHRMIHLSDVFWPWAKGSRDAFAERGITSLPATLDDYKKLVITATLEHIKSEGALGIKLTEGYSRALDYAVVSAEEATPLYAQMVAGAVDDAEVTVRMTLTKEHRALQDHLMFYVARECGRLGLVMTFHTGIGANPLFMIRGGDPLLLEPLVDYPDSSKTKFVLLHAGWPFQENAGAMLFKQNVYADISGHVFLQPPGRVAETLYAWLAFQPDKVMFGTDTHSEELFGENDMPFADWEEKAWISIRTGRQALAIALQRLIDDGTLTRESALRMARMVLRDNAHALYGLP